MMIMAADARRAIGSVRNTTMPRSSVMRSHMRSARLPSLTEMRISAPVRARRGETATSTVVRIIALRQAPLRQP